MCFGCADIRFCYAELQTPPPGVVDTDELALTSPVHGGGNGSGGVSTSEARAVVDAAREEEWAAEKLRGKARRAAVKAAKRKRLLAVERAAAERVAAEEARASAARAAEHAAVTQGVVGLVRAIAHGYAKEHWQRALRAATEAVDAGRARLAALRRQLRETLAELSVAEASRDIRARERALRGRVVILTAIHNARVALSHAEVARAGWVAIGGDAAVGDAPHGPGERTQTNGGTHSAVGGAGGDIGASWDGLGAASAIHKSSDGDASGRSGEVASPRSDTPWHVRSMAIWGSESAAGGSGRSVTDGAVLRDAPVDDRDDNATAAAVAQVVSGWQSMQTALEARCEVLEQRCIAAEAEVTAARADADHLRSELSAAERRASRELQVAEAMWSERLERSEAEARLAAARRAEQLERRLNREHAAKEAARRKKADTEMQVLKRRTEELESAVAAAADETTIDKCVVCWERTVATVLLDCMHVALCEECARGLSGQDCPICRTPVRAVQRIYRTTLA